MKSARSLSWSVISPIALLLTAALAVLGTPSWVVASFDLPNYCLESAVEHKTVCLDKNIEEVVNKLALKDFVAAIGSYSSRSLTQIDTLTFAGMNQIAPPPTSSAVSAGQVAGAKEELAQLASRPVVESAVDPAVKLTSKLDSTGQSLDQLKLNIQHATSDVGLIGLKWDSLLASDVSESLDATIALLEEDNKLVWLTTAWGWPELGSISAQEVTAKGSLVTVRNIVSTAGMQPEAYTQLKAALKSLEAIERLIGTRTDVIGTSTLFGRYNQTQGLADEWSKQLVQLDQLLVDTATGSASQVDLTITQQWKQLLVINQIPHAERVLTSQPRNKILGIRGLIQANRAQLANDQGETVTTTWLEEGSIIFKTLVANPSPLGRSDVVIRYNLPPEIQESDIINYDSALNVKLDEEKNQYYVAGNVTVAAGDTQVVEVRTTDVWHINSDQVASLGKQATDLSVFLANTPRYAQSVALKGDIQVALDKVSGLQNPAGTPEQKISAFRAAAVEMATAEETLAQLQQLGQAPAVAGWQSWLGMGSQPLVWLALAVLGLGLLLGSVWILLPSPKAPIVTTAAPVLVRQFQPFSEAITASDL